MKVKVILSTLLIGLMSVTAMAQKTELKAGETLNPGEALFSKNGNWVLIMENSVPSGRYGQFATFATKDFSLARDKGIMSSTPKVQVGKVTKQAQKLTLQGDDGNLATYDHKSGKFVWATMTHTTDPKKKSVKLIVEDDGSLSLFNSANQKTWNSRNP